MKVHRKRVQPIVGTGTVLFGDIDVEEWLASLEAEMGLGVGIPGGENVTDESKSIPYGCPKVEHY